MTKAEVLAIFARTGGYLRPDDIRLPSPLNRGSLYSYLLRLQRQGLLERMPDRDEAGWPTASPSADGIVWPTSAGHDRDRPARQSARACQKPVEGFRHRTPH